MWVREDGNVKDEIIMVDVQVPVDPILPVKAALLWSITSYMQAIVVTAWVASRVVRRIRKRHTTYGRN